MEWREGLGGSPTLFLLRVALGLVFVRLWDWLLISQIEYSHIHTGRTCCISTLMRLWQKIRLRSYECLLGSKSYWTQWNWLLNKHSPKLSHTYSTHCWLSHKTIWSIASGIITQRRCFSLSPIFLCKHDHLDAKICMVFNRLHSLSQKSAAGLSFQKWLLSRYTLESIYVPTGNLKTHPHHHLPYDLLTLFTLEQQFPKCSLWHPGALWGTCQDVVGHTLPWVGGTSAGRRAAFGMPS